MFNLNLFKTARPVMFARDPASEALPTPEPYGKVESLREAWETLQAALVECEKRLKRILDAYKTEKEIPPELLPVYKEYKRERDETKADIKKLEEREDFNKDEAWTDVDDATEKLVTNTLMELDGAYDLYKKKEAELRFDPANPTLLGPDFSEADARHVRERVKPKEKGEETTPALDSESKQEKSARGKETQVDWVAVYRDVAKKIVSFATDGTEVSLTEKEKNATSFMVKGDDTRTIILDGKKYILERDATGQFLRLRNYWLENGKDDEEKAKEDPYISRTGPTDLTPRWRTLTAADLSAREKRKREEAEAKAQEARGKNFDAAKEELNAEIERIFSEETPAGTILNLTDAAVFGPVAENDRKWEVRTQIELKRRYGGGVEARFLKQEVDILDNGTEGPPQTLSDETVIYRDSQVEDCRKKIVPDVEQTLQFAMIDPTPEESVAERMAYIERQLDWMSGNLTRASILPWSEATVRNEQTGRDETIKVNPAFTQWVGHIQKLIDRENITEWEQNTTHDFHGRHILIKNGLISVLELNKEDRGNDDGEKRQDDVPSRYAAVEKDWRLDESQLPPDLPESLRLV